MIPNRELEKVVEPERDTVIPVGEHTKKWLIPECDTLEEDTENCNLEKGGRNSKSFRLYPDSRANESSKVASLRTFRCPLC